MTVHIDKARGYDQPGTIDRLEPVAILRVGRYARADGFNLSADHENVRDLIE